MSDYGGYRNRFAYHRNDKKKSKMLKRNAKNAKEAFMYDEDSSNINDIPQSILDEQKKAKELMDMKKNEIQQSLIDEQEQNKETNNNNNNELSEEEYEEFTPDYFEPQVYVKK